ncbi:chorismate mutase [Crucibulum laeve]|uniref:Chorismate mutase n=1 Tax=Crucibulum laeve TaxID=68775 RepID=A0A5C3LI58_9AGAR|nr:chorismate mutase [Crucibulum laeve]
MQKWYQYCLVALSALTVAHASAGSTSTSDDFAAACYSEPLPLLPVSPDNRTIPWGIPSIVTGNTTCCSSLDEVRAGIDAVDAQLLSLLSQRAAFVREATRFKATHDVVDVPSRDQQVNDGAVADAPAVNLPQTIARAVFSAIINASVPFELCIVCLSSLLCFYRC